MGRLESRGVRSDISGQMILLPSMMIKLCLCASFSTFRRLLRVTVAPLGFPPYCDELASAVSQKQFTHRNSVENLRFGFACGPIFQRLPHVSDINTLPITENFCDSYERRAR